MLDPLKNKNLLQIENIAVYHDAALGDLLVSTAALYEITKLYPSAQITLIGSKLWTSILKPSVWPQIHFIYTSQQKKFNDLECWQATQDKNLWEKQDHKVVKSIQKFLQTFDMTIDFRSESIRFALQSFLARVPYRVGASQNSITKFFFTHFVKENNKLVIHERDRYLRILSSLNKEHIEETLIQGQQLGLPPLISPFPKRGKYDVIINPTASIREKAWPSKNFYELAMALRKQGRNTFIIGAPHETDWLQEAAQNQFTIIQPKNIFELICTVSQANLLITNTSSMQFIAASTKTPTITLMGSANPVQWGPLGPWSQFIKGTPNKASLANHKDPKDARKLETLCYNSIKVESIMALI